MGKFKVGDKVRVIDDAGGGKLGDVCTVTDLGDDGYIVLDGLTGGDNGLYDHRLELVTEKWQPKVGDRVRVTYGNGWDGEGIVELVTDFGTVNVKMATGEFAGEVGGFSIKRAEPAALTIEAGKFYKTRDGRKVGPMVWNDGRWFVKHALGTWNSDGTASSHHKPTATDIGDLIAEWVDEPAKFKVGDKIRHKSLGHTGHIKAVVGDNHAETFWTNVGWGATDPSEDIELITPTANKPTAIVALIEDGQPKPATRPYVHATEASARAEADRLASVHKGQQFGVYILTTTSQEAAPTYAHEWQRLAAKGEKIAAIKELRGITGLGLKTTKDAVENWLANDEPYARRFAA